MPQKSAVQKFVVPPLGSQSEIRQKFVVPPLGGQSEIRQKFVVPPLGGQSEIRQKFVVPPLGGQSEIRLLSQHAGPPEGGTTIFSDLLKYEVLKISELFNETVLMRKLLTKFMTDIF